MIADAIALIDFLRKHWEEMGVLSAMFDSDGTRLEGDGRLKVEKRAVSGRDDAWFYHITGPSGYVFVHMPVVSGLYADYAQVVGQKVLDADYFRYVNTPLSSTMGGAANTRVDFIVYGYRLKALLEAQKQ